MGLILELHVALARRSYECIDVLTNTCKKPFKKTYVKKSDFSKLTKYYIFYE